MKRIVCVLLLVPAFVPVTAQHVPPAAPPAVRIQQVGVPGVQHPMSMIVPDAEYAIVGSPDWLAMGENQVWTNSRAQDLVSRMDPYTNQTVAVVPVKNPCSGLIIAEGTLWAPSCEEKVVYRIDPATNGIAATIKVAPGSFTAVFGYGRVWVSSTEKSLVSVIHPATNAVIAEIPVDTAPRFMAA